MVKLVNFGNYLVKLKVIEKKKQFYNYLTHILTYTKNIYYYYLHTRR